MLKTVLRNLWRRFDRCWLALLGRWPSLVRFYYALWSPRFGREQRAVIAGRRRYHHRLGAVASSCPRLRRNIHRLEKGLVMRPLRPLFAQSYIAETVADLQRNWGQLATAEQRWAVDVLARYFATVSSEPIIDEAKARFASLPAIARNEVHTLAEWAPRSHASLPPLTLGFDDFLLLCQRRRSVRQFLDQAVDAELLVQAVAAAALAPSACNRQPFLFRAFTGADAVAIARLAMGTHGFADGIPALLVVLGDLACYPQEQDRHVIYIDGALAAMQLMLALETLGLASCPLNWPDIEPYERAMAEALALPPHLRPIMLLAVGHPDPEGLVPWSAKKSPDQLLRWTNDY